MNYSFYFKSLGLYVGLNIPNFNNIKDIKNILDEVLRAIDYKVTKVHEER